MSLDSPRIEHQISRFLAMPPPLLQVDGDVVRDSERQVHSLPVPSSSMWALDIVNRDAVTLPVRGPVDTPALSNHLRAVLQTTVMFPYMLRLSADCLRVNHNQNGTAYACIEFLTSAIVPVRGSPVFPMMVGHESSIAVAPGAHPMQALHCSISFGWVWASWPQLHRAVIRARMVLAATPSAGVRAQFVLWGTQSPNFRVRPECEFAAVCELVREAFLAEGLTDNGFTDFHISWQVRV